jgi:hypothetical protein
MKNSGKKTSTVSLVAVILGSLAGLVLAQETTEREAFINASDIKWGAALPSLPQGTKIAVLRGDPGKSGRLSFASWFRRDPRSRHTGILRTRASQ